MPDMDSRPWTAEIRRATAKSRLSALQLFLSLPQHDCTILVASICRWARHPFMLASERFKDAAKRRARSRAWWCKFCSEEHGCCSVAADNMKDEEPQFLVTGRQSRLNWHYLPNDWRRSSFLKLSSSLMHFSFLLLFGRRTLDTDEKVVESESNPFPWRDAFGTWNHEKYEHRMTQISTTLAVNSTCAYYWYKFWMLVHLLGL